VLSSPFGDEFEADVNHQHRSTLAVQKIRDTICNHRIPYSLSLSSLSILSTAYGSSIETTRIPV
jgi:hypothetical protein